MAELFYLRGSVQVLRLVGLYPLAPTTMAPIKSIYKIWQIVVYSALFVTLSAFLTELFTNKFDLIEEDDIFLSSGPYLFSTIQFTLFIVNLPKLTKLVDGMQMNFHYQSDHDFDNVSMEKTTKFVDNVARLWVFLCFCSSSSLAVAPLLAGERVLPLPTWKMDVTQSPRYELMYIWQYLAQISMGTTFGASDTGYVCILILLAQQFKVLRSNLQHCFFDALIKSGLTKRRVDEFRCNFNGLSKKIENSPFELENDFADIFQVINSVRFKKLNYDNLKNIVKHHKVLLEMLKEFDEFFHWILLFKMAEVTTSITFATYSALLVDDSSDLFGRIFYIFAANIQMVLYTWPGQHLTESANFLDAAYECPWYLCDIPWKRSFLIMQVKISRVIEVKAGGYFVMSLPAYVSFMKTIYSYITVLRQVSSAEK